MTISTWLDRRRLSAPTDVVLNFKSEGAVVVFGTLNECKIGHKAFRIDGRFANFYSTCAPFPFPD
jgi:hypothetical protein